VSRSDAVSPLLSEVLLKVMSWGVGAYKQTPRAKIELRKQQKSERGYSKASWGLAQGKEEVKLGDVSLLLQTH
jgi:hypothetical protein